VRPPPDTLASVGRITARPPRQVTHAPAPQVPARPPSLPPGWLRRWFRGALLDNLGLRFLSLVLAVTVFLLVNDDKDREITVKVGVVYILPKDKVLVSERLDEVRVTLRGPWRRLRHFDERELSASLDLRDAPSGEVPIAPDMIRTPAGLSVSAISPRSLRVAFDKRVEKLVDVSPQVTGKPLHGYVVIEVTPRPARVQVRGGERLLAALSSVRTRDVSLEGRTESFSAPATLVPPAGIELIGDEQVTVRVEIDEELVTRKVPGLTVRVVGDGVDPARCVVSPSHVDVTLTGALLAVEKAKSAMRPVARVTAGERSRELPVVLEGLPPGVGVRMSPERVRVRPAR